MCLQAVALPSLFINERSHLHIVKRIMCPATLLTLISREMGSLQHSLLSLAETTRLSATRRHIHYRHFVVQADVNVKLVMGLRSNVKKRVNIGNVAAGLNARKVIEKAVFDELVAMLDRLLQPFFSAGALHIMLPMFSWQRKRALTDPWVRLLQWGGPEENGAEEGAAECGHVRWASGERHRRTTRFTMRIARASRLSLMSEKFFQVWLSTCGMLIN